MNNKTLNVGIRYLTTDDKEGLQMHNCGEDEILMNIKLYRNMFFTGILRIQKVAQLFIIAFHRFNHKL